MQSFAALMVSVVLAAAGPLTQHALQATTVLTSGEVYVAELDANWNVTREVRLPCAIELGCMVDLGRVHVRFESVRAGEVAVNSVIEDASGKAAPQEVVTLALDRAGFGVGHYEAGPVEAAAQDGIEVPAAARADGRPIILMAVKAPGWVAPAGFLSPGGGDRT